MMDTFKQVEELIEPLTEKQIKAILFDIGYKSMTAGYIRQRPGIPATLITFDISINRISLKYLTKLIKTIKQKTK